jgi:hypothetical protein
MGSNGSAHIEAVVAAINATGVAEVVKSGESPGQVKITHRVQAKQLKVWLAILTHVLSRKQGWDAHVCKQYFLRGGKLLYAWNFIIQWETGSKRSEILKQVAGLISKAGEDVPREMGALESYPLMAKDGRNEPGGPMNVRAPGPMSGGYKQRGAHKIGGSRG